MTLKNFALPIHFDLTFSQLKTESFLSQNFLGQIINSQSRKDLKVRELVDLMKELFLIKEEKAAIVGLSGFKKTRKSAVKRTKKKVNKEVKLSDLMRRA